MGDFFGGIFLTLQSPLELMNIPKQYGGGGQHNRLD